MGLFDFIFGRKNEEEEDVLFKLKTEFKDKDDIYHYFTKVVGVTHQNNDGTERQKIIKNCDLFERISLEHEEENPYDKFAVKVCRNSGQQLGYLKKSEAKKIVETSRKGFKYAVFISDLTGGEKNKKTLGVNLLIVVVRPGVDENKVQPYLDNLKL